MHRQVALASDKRMMVLSSWVRHAIWIALVAGTAMAADDACFLLLTLTGGTGPNGFIFMLKPTCLVSPLKQPKHLAVSMNSLLELPLVTLASHF